MLLGSTGVSNPSVSTVASGYTGASDFGGVVLLVLLVTGAGGVTGRIGSTGASDSTGASRFNGASGSIGSSS